MAQSTYVQVSGAVAASPSVSALFAASLQDFLGLNLQATYGASKGGAISVDAQPNAPFVLPFEGVVSGRFFAMRLVSGQTVRLTITTALGTAVVPVSDEFVLHSPAPGDQFTALSISGTADLRYLLAGDVD